MRPNVCPSDVSLRAAGALAVLNGREARDRYIGRGGHRAGPMGSALSSWKGGVAIYALSDPLIRRPCFYCPLLSVPDPVVLICLPILHVGFDGVRCLPGRTRGLWSLVVPTGSGDSGTFLEGRIFVSPEPVINHHFMAPSWVTRPWSGYRWGGTGSQGKPGPDAAEGCPTGWSVSASSRRCYILVPCGGVLPHEEQCLLGVF